MARKTIAVCVTGMNWEYETRIVDGVRQRCMEQDINLLVFASIVHKLALFETGTMPENIVRGESEIFNLMNYDMVDGVITLGESIIDPQVVVRVNAECEKRGIPIINVNDPEHRLAHNVELSDERAMEKVIEHLIEKHGCRKIDFINGFRNNLQSDQRLNAYKEVLKAHGIPFEEERIAYGEFWRKAEGCTEQLVALDKPDAIVCANDTMALFCIDKLKQLGYRVPEDIIVTGFDGTKDCDECTPTLTSIRPAYFDAGQKAVEVIMSMWEGAVPPEVTYVNSELLLNESCGCAEKKAKPELTYYDRRYGTRDRYGEFSAHIREMNIKFSNAKTSSELYEETTKGAEFFRFNKMFICIRSDVERESDAVLEEVISDEYKGVSEDMMSMVQVGHEIPNGTVFPSKQLVPMEILNGDRAVAFAFTPLYFKERFLGYVAFEPSTFNGSGYFFADWLTAINNNAGSFYMKNELLSVASRLADLNIRDHLTTLFNRRGLEQHASRILKNAAECGETITVICADVDNLKPINDNFGHEGGDNAITRTAQAIKYSMPEGAVCARTGGDEFQVLLHGVSDDEVRGYIAAIETCLATYNKQSGMPYRIGCSCGFYSAKLSDEDYYTIERLADEDMYRVKTEKKTVRC